jgi:hypothetical protein
MVDRLRLLTAVNMLAPPSTPAVARRLAVSRDEAHSALTEAERVQLVAQQRESARTTPAGIGRRVWRLSEEGRAELYRLLHGE